MSALAGFICRKWAIMESEEEVKTKYRSDSMTYAFLLYPHANIRYRQSLLKLAMDAERRSCRRKWAARCSSRLKRKS